MREKIPPDEVFLISTDNSWGKRHVVALLGFCGSFMLYALRVNLSVAIVSMAKTIPDRQGGHSSGSCVVSSKAAEAEDETSATQTFADGEFDWGPEVQSVVLGSFFWGYLAGQIPGGQLAETFGSKAVVAYSIGITSLLTILTPMFARINFKFLVVLRAVEGLFEVCSLPEIENDLISLKGMAFPALHLMIAKWFPKSERGFMATVIYSGSHIGTVITMGTSGILIESGFLGGWPSVFYVFGFLGIVWLLCWLSVIHDEPDRHPRISEKELEHIGKGQGQMRNKSQNTPWRAIFTSVPVWALVVAHFGQNWGFYTLLFELPTYFKTVLGFNIRNNGLLSALPYLLQAISSWLSSYRFDHLIRRRYLKTNFVRKLSNTLAFIGPALCLYGVTLAKCDARSSVMFFAAAMGLNGLSSSGFLVTHVDMAPQHAGTLMGLTNCIASFPGILAPYVVGVITQNESTVDTWSYVFYICIAVYLISALVFIVFGSAHKQRWVTDVG